MAWQLVGSAHVGNDWILLGTITSNPIKFSIQSFDNPYDLARPGYLRQEFEPGLFSAQWMRIWPKPGESHILELPTYGYADSDLYLLRGPYNQDWILEVHQWI